MKFKKIFRSCIAFSMMALLLTTSCTYDDLNDIDDNYNLKFPKGELTCFSQATDAAAGSHAPRKTYMDNQGRHYWMKTDAIWVVKEDGSVKSDSIGIRAGRPQEADFFFDGGAFTQESYPILYVGDAETCNTVTIAAEQIQSQANNSEHYAKSGDCAKATATQDPNNKNFYSFEQLEHEAAYLYFDPYIEAMPTTGMAKLKKVVIKEKHGKNICGTYDFNKDDGLKLESVTNGGSEIVVYCGKNAKAVEAQEMSAGVEFNGFPIYAEKKPEENRVYLVIQPGEFDLDISYEIAYCYQQAPTHEGTTGYDWHDFFVELKDTTIKMDLHGKLEKNKFYHMRHKLHVDNVITPDHTYNFEEYYMWGAKKWFWDGVTNYPVHWDEAQSENAPQPGTSRWFDNVLSSNSRPIGFNKDKDYNWKSDNMSYGSIVHHRQGNNAGGDWNNALTANQASYYIIYGDAHYDNTTKWILRGYNGEPTYCVGGVWLKTKAAIERDEGISFPGADDDKMWANLAAPFTSDAASGQSSQPFDGNQYNLRYLAPWSNYRKTYTNLADHESSGKWKKPWELNASKKPEDYFFVPCLGRIEYTHQVSMDIPTFTLVGAQGFYWTRTPLMCNFGSTKYHYTSAATDYDLDVPRDNAFYVNIHYNYIALSWQQNGIYMKTGMRIACSKYFK